MALKGVIGADALVQTLEALKPENIAKELVKDSREIAKEVAERVRAEAPQGPTGNLKRAVEWGTFKKRPGQLVMSFVRMNRLKKGFHAHWIEFGARGGAITPNPYFRRGTSGDGPIYRLEAGAAKIIDDVLK